MSDGTIDSTLDSRQGTHGDFALTARIAQDLKHLIRANANSLLVSDQYESLDLIATKIARILSGNPNEPDHWRDIAGYARLVEKRLTGGAS